MKDKVSLDNPQDFIKEGCGGVEKNATKRKSK